MADEPKEQQAPAGAAGEKPAGPGAAPEAPSASPPPSEKPAAPKPAAPGAPGPAAPARPAAPPPPKAPIGPAPLDNELVMRFRAKFGEAVREALEDRKQAILVVDRERLAEIAQY